MTVQASIASAQGGMAPAPAAPAVAQAVRTSVVTASVPAVVTAVAHVAPLPTNDVQQLQQERATLMRQLNTLRGQAIAARQQLIQGNAGLSARQKKMDALNAELEQLRQAQQKELQAVEAASASPLTAEYQRIATRLQVINQTLAAQPSTVESAHP